MSNVKILNSEGVSLDFWGQVGHITEHKLIDITTRDKAGNVQFVRKEYLFYVEFINTELHTKGLWLKRSNFEILDRLVCERCGQVDGADSYNPVQVIKADPQREEETGGRGRGLCYLLPLRREFETRSVGFHYKLRLLKFSVKFILES